MNSLDTVIQITAELAQHLDRLNKNQSVDPEQKKILMRLGATQITTNMIHITKQLERI